MAKGDVQKNESQKIDTEQARNNSAHDAALNPLQNQQQSLIDSGNAERANILGGLGGFQNNGGLTDAEIAKFRSSYAGGSSSSGSGGGSGGGGVPGNSGSAFNTVNYDRNSHVNGVNLSDFANQKAGYNKFTDAYGGLTAEDRGNVNRASLLDQERTGGYSAGDIANIRARSSASAPAFFQNLKNEMQRGRSAQGANPNAAIDFKAARQQGQLENQNRVNTEIGINDSVRAGRSDAAKFLSQQGMGLAGLQSQNRLAGLGGLTNIDQIIGDQSLNKAGLLDNYGLNVAGLDMQKAGGLDNYDLQSRAIGAASGANQAALNSENERFLLDRIQGGREYGLTGQQNMYGTAYAPSVANSDLLLRGLGQQGSLNQGTLGLRLQNDQVNSKMNGLNTAVRGIGAAGSILSGLGGMGGGASAGGVTGGTSFYRPNFTPPPVSLGGHG
jgi:hypothetical protein